MKKRSATTQPPAETPEVQELIRQCAYELYEQRGREHGHDLDDWLAAESEVIQAVESEVEKQAA